MYVPLANALSIVEKGKDFQPVDPAVRAEDHREDDYSATMDLPQEGWYSAALHVRHGFADTRALKQLSLADEVHAVPERLAIG